MSFLALVPASLMGQNLAARWLALAMLSACEAWIRKVTANPAAALCLAIAFAATGCVTAEVAGCRRRSNRLVCGWTAWCRKATGKNCKGVVPCRRTLVNPG